MNKTIEQFVDEHIALLELERTAELEELQSLRENIKPTELQSKGLCITRLHIHDESTGLYGRCIVGMGLGMQKNPRSLPSNSFGPGDIVSLHSQTETSKLVATGMIIKVTENNISVAFEDAIESGGNEQFRLTKLVNDVTYRRLKKSLQSLKEYNKGPAEHIKNVLFGFLSPGLPLSLIVDNQVTWFNDALNECQKEAVVFALKQPEIGIVHGPPGTGKTTTVIEIILQAVKRLNFKLLVCAASNIAVDNLVQKLAQTDVKAVRLGHPGRTLPEVQNRTLDATILHSSANLVVKGVREDISKTQKKLKKAKSKGEIESLRRELGKLRKELNYQENKVIKDVLTCADVILATTTSASLEGPLKHLTEHDFDLVIIDEAAQALEASCWIPLLQAQRCILAGDHHQLPPTILSNEAATKGLALTLMERVTKCLGDQVTCMLTTQYRMHEAIMTWSSRQLYDNRLEAHESVKNHLLCHLPKVVTTEDTSVPLLFIDTGGCLLYEMFNEDSESKGNQGEVDIVEHHIDSLIQAGVDQKNLGVITPYNLQVELIKTRLSGKYPRLEVRSVDGFQGREKEAIVISLVRSNEKAEVGFLAEDRRMNVAVTRARRHLAVVGDSETIGRHPFLKSFFEYVRENGEIRSAAQYSPKESMSIIHEVSNTGDEEMVFAASTQSDYYLNRIENKKLTTVNTTKYPQKRKEKAVSCTQRRPPPENTHEGKTGMTKSEVEQTLRDFAAQNHNTVLQFPVTLSSRERAYVHEVADQMGLDHASSGEGISRFVTVYLKKETKLENEEKVDNVLDKDDRSTDYSKTVCHACCKEIPTPNLELHVLRCKEIKKYSHIPSETSISTAEMHETLKQDSRKKGARKKIKKSCTQLKDGAGVVEDIDAIIGSLTLENKRCVFEKCKESIATLGQKCNFCSMIYCLKHHMAEIHGCGQAVRAHAREIAFKQHTGGLRKGLKDEQRKHIKLKLDKKLGEMSQKRKSASKPKDSC